jgi:hypothetical protein
MRIPCLCLLQEATSKIQIMDFVVYYFVQFYTGVRRLSVVGGYAIVDRLQQH